MSVIIFFFNDTATTEIYTLSLHDALPICRGGGDVGRGRRRPRARHRRPHALVHAPLHLPRRPERPAGRRGPRRARDRKSTRLNSSHANISYAVFCLKKKKKRNKITR